MDRTDSRYPYTYAADYLREKIGDDYGRGLISRAAASRVRTLIADACGLDDVHVAEKLADAFMAENPEKQGYRIKTEQPVCGNCKHTDEYGYAMTRCSLGKFPVKCDFGTCKLHEWRK